MLKQTVTYCLIIITVTFTGCIEPIDPKSIKFDDLLVVEALITDQPGPQNVMLSRTREVGGEQTPRMEEGATVYMEDDSGRRINFDQTSPGVYTTSFPFAVFPDENWKLSIETANGRQYESNFETVLNSPSIDALYGEFSPQPSSENQYAGQFDFFVDATNLGQSKYLRWTWNSTFELSTATPSRWLWTGGNTFITRERGGANDDLQVEQCWNTTHSTQILLSALITPEIGITRLPITSFHSDERKMLNGYSIEVKQYAISEASYNYWNEIKKISQEQGGLTTRQVGSIRGNIKSLGDPDELVLGIFEVVTEKKVRRFFTPHDFASEGYRRRFNHFIECYDIEPVLSDVDEIGETMERLGPGYAIAYFTTSPPAAYYLPVRCAECTTYGSNIKPDFWE